MKDILNGITLTDRQIAIILAALAYWSEEMIEFSLELWKESSKNPAGPMHYFKKEPPPERAEVNELIVELGGKA